MSIWYILLITGLFMIVESRRRRYRDCDEDPIALREEQADVVLTGTADRIYTTSRSSYSCEVRIKRVIKGDRLEAGSTILIEGLGNEKFCDSDLKSGDSRIFLLSRLSIGLFRLNSSLLLINVPNLDKIQAAVKDELYRRRAPIIDEPCEKKYCSNNADCIFDKRIHQTSCRCPDSCIYKERSPVCGSDGITYPSLCGFRIETCKQKKKVYIKHDGICQIRRSF